MTSETCLLVIDDGREDYLERSMESIEPIRDRFATTVLVEDPDHKLGFAGAIDLGWDRALETGCRYIFHLESDFTIGQPLPDLELMACLLEDNPHLAQIALKRQPWNERETTAGGIVEADPADFRECVYNGGDGRIAYFTEHDRFFTTNPSLYPSEIAAKGWPQVAESEGHFTIRLRAEGYRFAFWGGKFDPPTVEHIGAVRTGTGY